MGGGNCDGGRYLWWGEAAEVGEGIGRGGRGGEGLVLLRGLGEEEVVGEGTGRGGREGEGLVLLCVSCKSGTEVR